MEKKRKSKKMRKPGFHALVWKEGNLYVSQCLEIELASQGKTKKEALANLEEALELFLEEENTSNLNGLFLDKIDMKRKTADWIKDGPEEYLSKVRYNLPEEQWVRIARKGVSLHFSYQELSS